MNSFDAALRIATTFAADNIPYAIGGAHALGTWGVARATKDVDVSVFVRRDELPRVLDSLERADVMVNRDDARRGVERIGLFNGRWGKFVVDVFLSEHPQFAVMAQRVRTVTAPSGEPMQFISPEDLCLYKLLFGRHKDIGDLESMLAGRQIDFDYVGGWLDKMTPAGDRRRDLFADLRKRFGATP